MSTTEFILFMRLLAKELEVQSAERFQMSQLQVGQTMVSLSAAITLSADAFMAEMVERTKREAQI